MRRPSLDGGEGLLISHSVNPSSLSFRCLWFDGVLVIEILSRCLWLLIGIHGATVNTPTDG